MLFWATFYNLNKINVWATQSELWAYVWDLLICLSTSHTTAVIHDPDFSELATCWAVYLSKTQVSFHKTSDGITIKTGHGVQQPIFLSDSFKTGTISGLTEECYNGDSKA